ncbi:hypothetical protein BJ165DRAFT_1409465 [Panaeolus papilionaceus]|nr:hypothetical protein BJ165DRAFT_1409465 [Panaeolus papilionaceus]
MYAIVIIARLPGSTIPKSSLKSSKSTDVREHHRRMILYQEATSASLLGPCQCWASDSRCRSGYYSNRGKTTKLPKDTKIPLEEIQKLTLRALNYSQQFDELLELKPNSKLNPDTFPNWTGGESLTTAMHSVNMEEVVLGSAPTSQLKQGARSSKENIFTELRQTCMGLGYAMDLGKNRVYFAGESSDWIIELRIVSIQKVDKKVPMFIINYKHEELPARDALEKIPVGYTPVVISDLERRILLALWDTNSERLVPSMQARARAGFRASVVLPLGSIGMRELGSLTHKSGCALCGKKSQNRCVGCLSVVYCSKACQKEDWPSHRAQCTSLKGATWNRVAFSEPGPPGMFKSMFNRKDQLTSYTRARVQDPSVPEEGPSYGKVFLAKFQIPLGSTAGDILVYDRQRTFTKVWKSTSSPSSYRLALQEANKYGVPKIYRWAKRVSEDEYEVCIDRAPTQVPVW